MKTGQLLVLTLVCGMAARADFSYTQTRKTSQAMPGGGDQITKHYLKGQKMKMETGTSATIMDFDAQTMTRLDTQAKTYTVTPFADLGKMMQRAEMDAKVEVKETGQKKNVNGFNSSEVVMTIAMEGGPAAAQGMKMQMEMDMWLSSEVPGAQEMRAFYQKNGEKLPWAALAGGGNPGMQKAIGDMQKSIAKMGGVPVMQIVRMKAAANPQMAAQMEQARARIEEMKKKGGQQAAMAEQMLARMGGAASGGSMFEITMESSGFSTSAIPDSVFAIPAGYNKVAK